MTPSLMTAHAAEIQEVATNNSICKASGSWKRGSRQAGRQAGRGISTFLGRQASEQQALKYASKSVSMKHLYKHTDACSLSLALVVGRRERTCRAGSWPGCCLSRSSEVAKQEVASSICPIFSSMSATAARVVAASAALLAVRASMWASLPDSLSYASMYLHTSQCLPGQCCTSTSSAKPPAIVQQQLPSWLANKVSGQCKHSCSLTVMGNKDRVTGHPKKRRQHTMVPT